VAGRGLCQERTGVPTTRDNVLITPGGQSCAVCGRIMATCNPGDYGFIFDSVLCHLPGHDPGVSRPYPMPFFASADDLHFSPDPTR